MTATTNSTTREANRLHAEAEVRVLVGGIGAEHTLRVEILEHVLAQIVAVRNEFSR
tara:strand:- start:461 stop:628 length:168 start_codon:yes stop_codon:yes gene_type:complete